MFYETGTMWAAFADKETPMFWFHHPKPFNQRAVVMQIVHRKAAAARDTSLIIVENTAQGPQTEAEASPQPAPGKP